ncbi:HTH-type transcriptional regulator SrpR [Clostridiales bacterium]|nr:HTH-type transcriptional regulator SrpR [Clostridiales bacterium]
MARKNSRNTKGRIIEAAWELFYEQGYDDTTIEEIIEKSQTSKGSFYHYFEGKDALLTSLSVLFDQKYEELLVTLDIKMNSFDKLMYFNSELFKMVENKISLDLLARLYSSQLITKGDRHLLDHNRLYFRVLRQTITEGQQRGQITTEFSVNEIVNIYSMCERALLYDWCICNGNYSLAQYSEKFLPVLMCKFRTAKTKE